MKATVKITQTVTLDTTVWQKPSAVVITDNYGLLQPIAFFNNTENAEIFLKAPNFAEANWIEQGCKYKVIDVKLDD